MGCFEIVDYFGFIRNSILKVTYMSYLRQVFEGFANQIKFTNQISGVSGFSF